MPTAKNVLGEPLVPCGMDPVTGYFRDGRCNTGPHDIGRHVVCVRVSAGFLQFSKSRGNDLTTPRPDLGFPGLKPGNQWCLCAARWQEALEAGRAPPVVLSATHVAALQVIRLEDLKRHALDLC
jgi:uncharacterized protein